MADDFHFFPKTTARRLPWPKRVDIVLLTFFASVVAYCDRVNISVAAPLIMRDYHWDTGRMGWVLSGFFIGYVMFMIPFGILADRCGPKRVLAWSVAWWSAFTALTPISKSLPGMTCIRVLIGTGESGMFPSMNSMLVRWFPREEYSRATGFGWSGGYAGPVLAFPLSSAVVGRWGWKAVFFLFASLGLLWLPFWLKASSDRPELSRGIDKTELEYIARSRPDVTLVRTAPWRRMLLLPALWATLGLHFSCNWYYYVMLSWLPTYLLIERQISLANVGVATSLPFLSALFGTNLAGPLIDRLSHRRDRTRVRKGFLLLFFLAACTLPGLSHISSPTRVVLLLSLGMALYSAVAPVYSSSSLDLAPRHAGMFVGIQNTVANFAGVAAPVVIGYVVKAVGWSAAFWLTAAVSSVGILIYLVFGSTRQVIE